MINALSTTSVWAGAAAGGAAFARGPGGCLFDPSNPSSARTEMLGGKAVFENNNYRITAGDDNEVLIHNKNTGETYRAWGDPHMDIDGKHSFDFWGTTTFALDDGTKVTIQTTPWGHDPNATLSSKVTITNGDYGVQITGVDTNTVGDLAIDEGKGWGRLVDLAVDDGNVLHENTFGKGFLAMDSRGKIRQVDQQYINETDLLKGGALSQSFGGAFGVLQGLLAISFVGVFISSLGALVSSTPSTRGRDAAPPECPRVPDLMDFLRPQPGRGEATLLNWTLHR